MKHYGNLKKTWLHQQGQGTARGYRSKKQSWFCDGCLKHHSKNVTKFVSLDGKAFCLSKFSEHKFI